ncbi:unnamed protein product [[Candida] boidinii]|uniref:Unnamed protein product n=1 Tax=Candida boidinii TaxID=5477 RepID=A0A9W6SWX6_CANBO|nr:hypothetical protein B5S30_g1257 [[Candida] boidinii]OWB84925.1 hypothetical protein B5S33_g3582 [[Candida] boidinii]GME67955.1 unnamed protein product [[Candida] boidinii]GMF97729.1 unnamed protein product [[Candida] boidinii]
MSSNYWISSQRRKWQFTQEGLISVRNAVSLLDSHFSNGGNNRNFNNSNGNNVSANNSNINSGNGNIGNGNLKYDTNMRIYFHQLIIKLGRKLNLRQVILATAELYLTRFLTRVSIREVNVYLLISTCIYVSCKIEENPQHIRTILSESRNCWPEFIPNDLTKLAEFEFYLIEELDCYLVVYHPYDSLLDVINILKESENNCKIDISPEELQTCWSIINDSYITDLHLLLPPHIIAIGALYFTLVLGSDIYKRNGVKNSSNSNNNSGNNNNNNSNNNNTVGGSVGNNNNNSINNSTNNMNNMNNKNINSKNIDKIRGGSNIDSNNNSNNNGKLNNRISSTANSSSLNKNTSLNNSSTANSKNTNNNTTNTNTNTNNNIQEATLNPRIENFIRFLAVSNIDLDEVIETVQEFLTLYESWNSYDEVYIRNGIHHMLLSMNG